MQKLGVQTPRPSPLCAPAVVGGRVHMLCPSRPLVCRLRAPKLAQQRCPPVAAAADVALRAMMKQMEEMQKTIDSLKEEMKATKDDMSISCSTDMDSMGNPDKRLAKADWVALPNNIILVRHGQSRGNTDAETYSNTPDNRVPLTAKGRQQARDAGARIRESLSRSLNGQDLRIYFMTSPYCRALQTCQSIADSFDPTEIAGVRQAVQLREQDFGNFQDPSRIRDDMDDRLRFGRFWYRFTGGESGADVYDRLTIFEDHMSRDMMNGRFRNASVCLVTHGLTLRVFLMRWFHWTVDEFLQVWNPQNGVPIILEKLPWAEVERMQKSKYVHVKHVYHINRDQLEKSGSESATLRGVTPSMVSYVKRVELAQLLINSSTQPPATPPQDSTWDAVTEIGRGDLPGFVTMGQGGSTDNSCSTPRAAADPTGPSTCGSVSEEELQAEGNCATASALRQRAWEQRWGVAAVAGVRPTTSPLSSSGEDAALQGGTQGRRGDAQGAEGGASGHAQGAEEDEGYMGRPVHRFWDMTASGDEEEEEAQK